VAQIASVFGRQFDYQGISNMLPGRSESLEHALQALESAGIVYRIKEPHDTVFVFNHVTIQEAAYSSLLKEERRELHARVASWLLQETAIGESSQPAPFWAITTRGPETFRKQSRPGCRQGNLRSADQPPRRPWPIFARAFR
jgi:hypothetical protein